MGRKYFSELEIPICQKCFSGNVVKINIIHPGNSVFFKCLDCNEEMIIDYDYDYKITMDIELWYEKYLQNQFDIKFTKIDIEKFCNRKLSENEWNFLKVSMSICQNFKNVSIIPHLTVESSIHLLEISCRNCNYSNVIVLDNFL